MKTAHGVGPMIAAVVLTAIALAVFPSAAVAETTDAGPEFQALEWRFVGPPVGSRGTSVVGHPTDEQVFWFGMSSGGLWKTDDAGLYWEPVGDKDFNYGSIGAMEFSESNPDIAYVGLGEPQMRNNVSWGDGVYKTTDNGKTWTLLKSPFPTSG